jgi:hypothetical protein
MKTSLSYFVEWMKRGPHLLIARSAPALLMLGIANAAVAQEINSSKPKALVGGSYVITSSTLDAGGGSGSGGSYRLESSIGQPDAGGLTSARYRVQGGFWVEQGSASSAIFSSGFE